MIIKYMLITKILLLLKFESIQLFYCLNIKNN